MDKDFDSWFVLKKQINDGSTPRYYKERDIWWAALGCNIGVEEDGKNRMFDRPVVIVKGFSPNLAWAVPLSTTAKRSRYYYPFITPGGKANVALLSQLRTIDTLRLLTKMGMMDQKSFNEMKLKLIELLA